MRTVALGEIVADARPGFASGENTEDGIVQVRMNNVTTEGTFDWSKLRRVPEPKNIDELVIKPNDILFNATNSPDLVGKNAVFRGFSEPVTFSNHFIRIRLNEDMADSRLVSRWLTDQWRRGKFKSMCRQWVNQASLNKEQLLSLPIPLPPIDEQRRIAAILDEADDLRRKRQRVLERLKRLPLAVMEELLNGENTATVKRLDELIKRDDRINYGVVQPGPEVEQGVPLIRVENVVDEDFSRSNLKHISPQIEAQYSRSRLRGDEVLVACVGSIGAVALVQVDQRGFNIARAVARIPIDPIKAERIFVAEYLKRAEIQAYFKSETRAVAQPTLNIKQLCETSLPVPALSVQRIFAARVTEINKLKAYHRAHLAKLDALFASLRHRAFRGEL